jgi:D-3-phosphoglycerate dehydrogenase
VSGSGPVVGLLDEFDPELVDVFRRALPEARVVEQEDSAEGGGDADFLVTWKTDIREDMMAGSPSLRGIVKLDSGSAVVAAEAAQAHGIRLDFASSPALVSVAEHTVMLILAVFKRLGSALDQTRAGHMAEGVSPRLTDQENYSYNWVGLEKFEAVYGKTVGLVGLGRIGSAVASMLSAFNANVVYTKRNRLGKDDEQELRVTYLRFEELLQVSHCVSLHNRFYDGTERMMGKEQFALMPEGSFFVNTARGRLVDEDALCAALTSGHLAGAALDVFWFEPPKPDSPVWSAPNLLMTPHTGGIPIRVSLADELTEAAQLIGTTWAELEESRP